MVMGKSVDEPLPPVMKIKGGRLVQVVDKTPAKAPPLRTWERMVYDIQKEKDNVELYIIELKKIRKMNLESVRDYEKNIMEITRKIHRAEYEAELLSMDKRAVKRTPDIPFRYLSKPARMALVQDFREA